MCGVSVGYVTGVWGVWSQWDVCCGVQWGVAVGCQCSMSDAGVCAVGCIVCGVG